MVFRSMPRTTCKAASGAVDLTVAKLFLSQQVSRNHYEGKFSLSKVALGSLSSAILSEGKTLRPDGGALESGNGSLQREAAALQPLLTFLHVEPEIM